MKTTKKTIVTEKPTNEDRQALRLLVRAREDFQFQRKAMDNRIGRKADGTSQDINERPMRGEDLGFISIVADECRKQEDAIEKELKKVLKRFPVYNEFLVNVKGVGTIAAAKIIGEFDIFKASTVSKLWQFAGLNPSDVRGKKAIEKSKYTADMGDIVGEYEERPGSPAKWIVQTNDMVRGDRLTPGYVAPFNGNLRTALVGVLADGFIKAQAPYCMDFYYPYKARLEQEESIVSRGEKAWSEESKGHRDRAAKRYMIKMFIKDLYVAWRTIEGLEVRKPYQEEYLGHKHEA